jgi:hypothetical protein
MTQPVPYQQYPTGAPQPLFWPELVGIMIDIAILAVIFSWAFSQVKKVFRGEEVKLPGG